MSNLLLVAVLLAICSCSKRIAIDDTYYFEEDISCCRARISMYYMLGAGMASDCLLSVRVYPNHINPNSPQKCNTNVMTEDGKMSVVVGNLWPNTTYHYWARFIRNGENYDSPVRTFKTPDLPSGAIDMGLSVKWASHNLGAEFQEALGPEYAWGEIHPKQDFEMSNYAFYDASKDSIKKYNESDGLKALLPEDDVASLSLGNEWRIPTKQEFQELKNNSYSSRATYYSIEGVAFTSLITGQTIFFPLSNQWNTPSCYIWTKTLSSTENAWVFQPNQYNWMAEYGRERPAQIRPVKQ